MSGVNNALYYVDKKDEDSVFAISHANDEENYNVREEVYTRCREQLHTQLRYTYYLSIFDTPELYIQLF